MWVGSAPHAACWAGLRPPQTLHKKCFRSFEARLDAQVQQRRWIGA
jgi:hypothetical protein